MSRTGESDDLVERSQLGPEVFHERFGGEGLGGDAFDELGGGVALALLVDVFVEPFSERLELALAESGCGIEGLAFISPHGSGSRPGDRSELCSIQRLLGGRAPNVPLVGFKPYTGHMGAASDLGEVVLGLKALEEQMVPATLNFAAAEDAFSTMRISSAPQPCLGSRFLCTALGMGGRATSVVLEG